jgi:hypothetical protein
VSSVSFAVLFPVLSGGGLRKSAEGSLQRSRDTGSAEVTVLHNKEACLSLYCRLTDFALQPLFLDCREMQGHTLHKVKFIIQSSKFED